METNVLRSLMNLRLLTTAIAVVGLAGCNLTKQSAPDLTGPSTLGRSVVLTASPDRILYDGTTQATVTATVRNAAGDTEANVALRWEAAVVQVVSGNQTLTLIPVEPFPQVSTTGSNGTATTTVRAPVAPEVMPSGIVSMRVYAVPIGDDASTLAPGVDAKPRFVTIELVPQTGSAAPDRLPIVDFLVSPPIANINDTVTFDGSLTRDEGVICGDNCTYRWDFGSNVKVQVGRIITMSFATAGTYSFTLNVTDARGFTAAKSGSVKINQPAAPTASFFFTPVQPRVGQTATFDASASTVGIGATIVSYAWDFGELGNTGTGETTTFAYTPAGAKSVRLIVTDDLGRTAQTTLSVTVIP